jgi:hypothetical protein
MAFRRTIYEHRSNTANGNREQAKRDQGPAPVEPHDELGGSQWYAERAEADTRDGEP